MHSNPVCAVCKGSFDNAQRRNATFNSCALFGRRGGGITASQLYRRFFCGKGGNSLCLKSLSMLFRQVRKTCGRRVRSFINVMELRPLQVCLQQTCGKRDFWKTGMPRRTKYHNRFCASKSGADCKTNIRFQIPSVQSANAPPPATS